MRHGTFPSPRVVITHDEHSLSMLTVQERVALMAGKDPYIAYDSAARRLQARLCQCEALCECEYTQ